MLELPTVRLEGFDAMMNGMEQKRASQEYRCGFCWVPEKYKPGSTERDNFLVGCRYAVFGRPQ